MVQSILEQTAGLHLSENSQMCSIIYEVINGIHASRLISCSMLTQNGTIWPLLLLKLQAYSKIEICIF